MPFKSDAQRRFAFGTNQPWAKKWADETPKGKDLPERVDVEKGALRSIANRKKKGKKGKKGASCKSC